MFWSTCLLFWPVSRYTVIERVKSRFAKITQNVTKIRGKCCKLHKITNYPATSVDVQISISKTYERYSNKPAFRTRLKHRFTTRKLKVSLTILIDLQLIGELINRKTANINVKKTTVYTHVNRDRRSHIENSQK